MMKKQFKKNYVLGKGSFSTVFHGTDMDSSDEVALKVTDCKFKRFHFVESEVLGLVSGCTGFPELIWSGQQENSYVVAMTLFCTSIQNSHLRESISIPEVLKLGKQLTSAFKVLHKLGYIHRDVKTENIAFDCKKNSFSLIDFGLAKKYKVQGSHVPLMMSSNFIGNLVFCSNNVLTINQASRRDDLVSLGFVLMYLILGSLPWANHTSSVEEMIKARNKANLAKLLKAVPKELDIYINHCLALDFYQKPNYKLLKSLMTQGKLRILHQFPKLTKSKKPKRMKTAHKQESLPNDSTSCSTMRSSAPSFSESLRAKLAKNSHKL